MKHARILALVLLFTLVFGTPVFAAVSDYPVIKWSRIEYYGWDDELYAVSITINGAVGKQVEDGIVESPYIPYVFVDLYYGEEVWQNEDGTYTVYTEDGEMVLTEYELIFKYADDRVRIIPVVDGATMLIKNLIDPQIELEYYPGGYVFLDEECTLLAKDVGQIDNYYTDVPFTFNLYDTARNGMNVFAYEFPLDLIIDGEVVSYAILNRF